MVKVQSYERVGRGKNAQWRNLADGSLKPVSEPIQQPEDHKLAPKAIAKGKRLSFVERAKRKNIYMERDMQTTLIRRA